jgi:hypothetical protein
VVKKGRRIYREVEEGEEGKEGRRREEHHGRHGVSRRKKEIDNKSPFCPRGPWLNS